MKIKKKFISIAMITIFSVSAVSTASAAYQGWHLVDSGKHLDYKDTSSYGTSVTNAVNIWNNYKSGVIREDSWNTIKDVHVSDYTQSNNVLGVTSSAGTIKLNTTYYKNMTNNERTKTTTHEFGHALGLDHTTGSSDIMIQGKKSTTSLSSTDKSSYDAAYKKY